MIEEDIRRFYAQPWVMVASDGGIGLRHPRSAGTFPRVLGKFVREQRWFPLQEAIRKMTSAPAARLKLADRGTIAAGKAPTSCCSIPPRSSIASTFQEPFVLATGVERRLGQRRARVGRRQADRRRARPDAGAVRPPARYHRPKERGARMNVDRYTKAVLTVIAGCLLWICAMGAGPSLGAQPAASTRITNDTCSRWSSSAPARWISGAHWSSTTSASQTDGRATDPTVPVSLPYTPASPLSTRLMNSPESPLAVEISARSRKRVSGNRFARRSKTRRRGQAWARRPGGLASRCLPVASTGSHRHRPAAPSPTAAARGRDKFTTLACTSAGGERGSRAPTVDVHVPNMNSG